MKILIMLIIAAMLGSMLTLYAQDIGLRDTKIDSILINGRRLDSLNFKDIVISINDSITFFYSCDAKGGDKTDFLFRLKLKNNTDSSAHVFNNRVLSYKGLPEENYRLDIQAIDPLGTWRATMASVSFRIDNRESALRKEVVRLQQQLEENKKLLNDNNSTLNSKKISYLSILFGMFLGFISLSVILFLYVRTKKKSIKKDIQPNIFKKIIDMKSSSKSNDIDKLLAENSNLRAEVAALRGQIDAMQQRAGEMNGQNRELEDKVSRLAKSKYELEELQKQKDELFAVIIHDIKNPASLIKSLVELLRSYDLTATEQQEIIQDIVETTAKIVSLSQEVSRILSLESSNLVLDLEVSDINQIIKSVYHRNKVAAEVKHIEFTLNLDPKVPEVELDPQKIEDVIDNLVSNAVKFTHNKGKVCISSRRDGENAVIEISDDGLGLSQDDVRRAFQRGARLSARPTSGESSTGLGLWIVKKLTEAHNGKVWVKSIVGKGSTFGFSLPLKQHLC
ncbi:MAG: Histidine kinase protein [Bacteroidota bacterium]|nr:Histidine kinase protein [Bacteroidota bacterium]